ncbi:MAG: helicase-related protein [Candidatus Methanomethylophilaceae archaeon]
MNYVSHPRILPGKIEDREYQRTVAKGCLKNNTLIILPTGLGKTVVSLFVIAEILEKGKKVLFLAPTKPLADQHGKFLSETLKDTSVGVMTGETKPEVRASMVDGYDVIVATPQTVANDLENGRYGTGKFGLVIYDEAHRGTGNYAYVTVAKYCGKDILSMGMTASPGSDIARIEEVCSNLALRRIDMRDEGDPDVSPFVFDTYVKRIEVGMPKDLRDIIALLRKMLDHYITELTHLGLFDSHWPPSTKHLLVVGETLQRRLASGEKSATVFRGLTVQGICIKLLHAISLAETQGMSALRAYLLKLSSESKKVKSSKGTKELAERKEFAEVMEITMNSSVEHPKISRVMSIASRIINSGSGSKVIVFTQYRDTCDMLVEKLSIIPGARVGKLIGQSRGGLKQKEQIEVLKGFRDGTYNIVVSTSVGEEGLDVASTDAVIFYEPVPSEIRTIQRRGRTGRKNDGEVYVLIAKGTIDEVFERSSLKKESLMRSRLENLGRILEQRENSKERGQMKLGDFH